ncbi:MAG TPA: TolC family protein, partial [Verrucomicrobiae bacterium]|nr:TolC family protein [Verrucomicrobiae bacterium]
MSQCLLPTENEFRAALPQGEALENCGDTRSTPKRPPLLLFLPLLLAGCAVGPNYQAPKTEAAPSFANGDQTNFSSSTVALEWWRGFNDPVLDRLVTAALATNQDLRIATARVREARALRTQALADAFPVVDGTASYSKTLSSQAAVPFPLDR